MPDDYGGGIESNEPAEQHSWLTPEKKDVPEYKGGYRKTSGEVAKGAAKGLWKGTKFIGGGLFKGGKWLYQKEEEHRRNKQAEAAYYGGKEFVPRKTGLFSSRPKEERFFNMSGGSGRGLGTLVFGGEPKGVSHIIHGGRETKGVRSLGEMLFGASRPKQKKNVVCRKVRGRRVCYTPRKKTLGEMLFGTRR